MKDSMYKQVGFLYTFEIMVSKERRGSFNVLSPFLVLFFFFFFALLSFFLLLVGFLVAWLNQKFSARQSVAGSTDGNWWSDIILCIMWSLFLATALVWPMLAAVLSQRVVLQGHRRNRGNIRITYNKCIFHVSLCSLKGMLEWYSASIPRIEKNDPHLLMYFFFFF